MSLALVLFPLRLSSCVQLHGSQMSLEIVGKGPSSLFPSYTVPLAHRHRTEHLPLFDCLILAPALPFSRWENFEVLYQPPIVLNILHRFMSLKNLMCFSYAYFNAINKKHWMKQNPGPRLCTFNQWSPLQVVTEPSIKPPGCRCTPSCEST